MPNDTASGTKALPVFADRNLEALYAQSLRSQWRVDQVIDWPAVDLAALGPSHRSSLGRIYVDTLFAEKLGLELAQRSVECAPESDLRHLASMQLRDEARHVDFFSRLCSGLQARTEPSPQLLELRRNLQNVRDYDELLLQGHVLEVAARALFLTNAKRSMDLVKRSVRLPGTNAMLAVLHVLTAHIGGDESRHIAFGHRCLRTRLKRLPARQIDQLERRATTTALLMHATFAQHSSRFQAFGLDDRRVLASVWNAMDRTLASLEFDLGNPRSLRSRTT